MANNKINKEMVPEGFSVGLALVDALPCIFFGLAFILLGIMLKSWIFILGAVVCTLSGLIKVLWKIIVALQKKNVWPLFVQMRIAMPIGFVIMLVGFIICVFTCDLTSFWNAFVNIPTLVFFGLGVVGMIVMIVFAFKLDSADAKSNWIEQLTNGIAQLCFALGILIALL